MRYAFVAVSLFAATLFGQESKSPVFDSMVKDAKTRVRQVTVKQFQEMTAAADKPILIDVREDNEWDAGHAKNAMHIGRGVLDHDIETKVPRKDTPLVLYCGGGMRSALAADVLTKMGYTNVSSLDGGLRAYKAAGLPIEKSESSALPDRR